MSANLGTAWIQVKPSMDGVRGAILSGLKGTGANFGDQMGSEVRNSSGMTAGMAAIWGAASAIASKAIDAIASKLNAAIDGAILRVDTLNNASRTFANMGFDATASADAMKKLEKSILGLPTSLDSATRGMVSLSATYGDVSLGQKVFSSLNNAILGFGGTADMVSNAILQLSQMPLDGPLDAQTWNSLRNSGLTPVLVAMSKEFGMSVSQMKEALGSGQMKVQDFVNELVKMNDVGGGGLKSLTQIALDSTKGIGNSMTNAQTAVTRGVAAIINALGSAGIADAISSSGKSMELALKGVASAIKWVQDNSELATSAVYGLAAAMTYFAASQIASNIGSIGTGIGALLTKLIGFGKLAFVPVIIGAIVGALALFVMNSGGIDGAGQKITDVFNNVASTIKGLIAQLPGIISAIVNFVTTQLPQIFTSIVNAVTTNAPMIWQGFKDLISGVIQALYTQGPSLIQTFVDILGKVVDFITANIGKFATVGTELLVNLLNGITAALPGLIEAGVTIINNLVDSIVKQLPMIIDSAIKIINLIVTTITANLPKIITAAIMIFTALISGLISVLPSLIDAALKIILALANALLKNLPLIINAAIQLITALVTALLNNLPAIINAAVKLIVALAQGLISALPQLIDAAVRLISELAGGLIANLPLLIAAAVTLMVQLAWALIQAIPLLVSAAFQLIFGLIGAILGMIPQLISTGWQLIVALVKGIAGSIGSVISGAAQIGQTILDTLGEINLFDIGKNLITGLWNGISNMAGWIGEKIKGFGDGVMNGIKDFFGIHSPSIRMRDEVGKMIGLGTADGIAGSTKVAVKAAQSQSAAVLNAFSNLSGATFGITPNMQLAGAGAGGNGNVFYITNPSPEETAAIVASRIKTQGGEI